MVNATPRPLYPWGKNGGTHRTGGWMGSRASLDDFAKFRLHRDSIPEPSTLSTWSDNKVRELIAVKVLNTTLVNATVVAFKVLPLGSYALMPAPSPPFKTILELVLWNGIQSCRCNTPDVIDVIKMPSFQYFLYLQEQRKGHWGLIPINVH